VVHGFRPGPAAQRGTGHWTAIVARIAPLVGVA